MKRIVLAPDSFKGSLSAREVAAAMTRGLLAADADVEIQICPMADGGEGTLDAVAAACGGTMQEKLVTDANGHRKPVSWLLFRDGEGEAALVEAACIVGLPEAQVAVDERTTTGVGELVLHLLDAEVHRIFIALGGTSTNEGGIGALAALGARCLDAVGQQIAPTLSGLARLAAIDFSGLDVRLARTELILLTDVRNPLCGPSGATAVFGLQKGVRSEDVAAFDACLSAYARLGDAWAGHEVSMQPGSGAAGGLGYALMLAGGKAESGAKRVAQMVGLPDKLYGADLVITGEGRSDAQTLMGKVAAQVAALAREQDVPTWLVSGAIDEAALPELQRVFSRCIAASDPLLPLAQAMARTAQSLEQAMCLALTAQSRDRGEDK